MFRQCPRTIWSRHHWWLAIATWFTVTTMPAFAVTFSRTMPPSIELPMLVDMRSTLSLSDAQWQALRWQFDSYSKDRDGLWQAQVPRLAAKEDRLRSLTDPKEQLWSVRSNFRIARNIHADLMALDIRFFEDCSEMLSDAQIELLPIWQLHQQSRWTGTSFDTLYQSLNLLKMAPENIKERNKALRAALPLARERARTFHQLQKLTLDQIDQILGDAILQNDELILVTSPIQQILHNQHTELRRLDQLLPSTLQDVFAKHGLNCARRVPLRTGLADADMADDRLRKRMLDLLSRIEDSELPQTQRVTALECITENIRKLDPSEASTHERYDLISTVEHQLHESLHKLLEPEHWSILNEPIEPVVSSEQLAEFGYRSQSLKNGPIPERVWAQVIELLGPVTICNPDAALDHARAFELRYMETDVDLEQVDRQIFKNLVRQHCTDAVHPDRLVLAEQRLALHRRMWAIGTPGIESWIHWRAALDPLTVAIGADISIESAELATHLIEETDLVLQALDDLIDARLQQGISTTTEVGSPLDRAMAKAQITCHSACRSVEGLLQESDQAQWKSTFVRSSWPQVTGPLALARHQMNARIQSQGLTPIEIQHERRRFATLVAEITPIEEEMLSLLPSSPGGTRMVDIEPQIVLRIDILRDRLHLLIEQWRLG